MLNTNLWHFTASPSLHVNLLALSLFYSSCPKSVTSLVKSFMNSKIVSTTVLEMILTICYNNDKRSFVTPLC